MRTALNAFLSASLLVSATCAAPRDPAARSATELLPETAVLYVCVPKPAATIDLLLDHPTTSHVLETDAAKAALNTKDIKQLRAVVGFVEADLDMKWREALTMATSEGIHVCVDAKTEGLAVLIKTTDENQRHKLLARLMQLARDDAESKGKPDPYETQEYRGITAYKIDESVFAEFGPWLMISNKSDLAKFIGDTFLDGTDASLATAAWFTNARASANTQATAWAVLDLDTLRDAGVAKDLFANRTENIAAELLLGGIQSTLCNTQHVAASLEINEDQVALRVAAPFDAGWISEARGHFFGDAAANAPPPLKTSAELMSVSAYRDLSHAWLYASDTLIEKGADELAEGESGLSNLFGGRDFGEEVLGAFKPGIRLIIARQKFSDRDPPLPAIRLPAFAVTADLKDENMVPELRRIFQSLIGFFNIVGAMNGQPQLEMDMEKAPEVQTITSRFLPTADNRESHDAAINYNFSPSVAFAGDRFVLASSMDLARELATAEATTRAPYNENTNTLVQADFDLVHQSLKDNREHLISQNMLKKGHSRDAAEKEIDTFLGLLRLIDSGKIQLNRHPARLELGVKVDLNRELSQE